MTKFNTHYITRIVVKNLFGMFDYILDQTLTGEEPGRIIILYGDNGSGKTTIVRTIFHLLAPDAEAGHKTEIARTPFSLFEITLNDKTQIRVERPSGELLGSFTITIKLPKKRSESFKFMATEELAIPSKGDYRGDYSEIRECFSRLRTLNLALFHLADDRTIELAGAEFSKTLSEEFELDRRENIIVESRGYVERRIRRLQIRRPGEISAELLIKSIERFTAWILNQAFRASSLGESSVHTLYNEILHRLARLPAETPSMEFDITSLENRINKIEAHSKSLAEYGFLPEFSGREILNQISIAKAPQKLNVMAQVVTPYLESLERRIEALRELSMVLDNFLGIINGFLSHKQLNFNIHKGLNIKTYKGNLLSAANLSSGERHLLLIFCNTVLALDYPSIFIIDEPEISLNIKWQRSLISSLCNLIENKPIQYILATHSLEIISQYRDRIWNLAPISK
jgi:energy-coupling factor transporter ATP-binding protein EcfA2